MALKYSPGVLFTVQASRAEANQRVLVRKSLHQLHEYNHEQNDLYHEPVNALDAFTKNWERTLADYLKRS